MTGRLRYALGVGLGSLWLLALAGLAVAAFTG